MLKSVIIGFLGVSVVLCLALAYRNAKPVCMDLVRLNGDLMCVYDLGDTQEDSADVIMVEKTTTLEPLTQGEWCATIKE